MDTLEWTAPEYEDKERSRDWFWALGVIVVAGSAAAAIYGDYFFAALIVIGGVLLGYFASRRPDLVHYELGPRGLRINDRVFPYDSLKSFSVMTEPKSLFIVHTGRYFMPIISIPMDPDMGETVHGVMTAMKVPEEKLVPHTSETIMDSLGF